MGTPLLTRDARLMCPHGGQVTLISTDIRAKAQNGQIMQQADTGIVAGCPFMVGPKPQPCVTVRWMVGSLRVRVNGQAALLRNSVALCFSAEQIPQGAPQVLLTQMRAKGQ
jgi:hypothetical protein